MQLLQRLSTSQWLRTIVVLALSFGFVKPSGGQQIGFDVCSCAPSTYEFKFDFSLFCPPINITQGDAVLDTSCLVSPFQDQTVGDLVPIAVQEITVMELDQNLDNLYQEIIRGSFKDGDTWSYTSVAAQPGKNDPLTLPRGIQFNIVGINILEQPIINTVIITFSNSCQAYPVLIPGQYAGWVRFLELEEPLADYCPFTPDEPSAAPSPFTPGPTFPPTPPGMSMSMDLGMLDLLEDEFGLQRSDCSESSSTRYTKKSAGKSGKGGKGGSSPKGSKKMGKGGAGKGGSSGDSSSMMTDPSLKSDSSSKGKSGKGGKGGKGSESGSGSRRLLRSKGSKRTGGDCDGKGGKATKKAGKSGKGGSSSAKSGKGESAKGSKKMSKGGKGGKGGNGGKGGDSGSEDSGSASSKSEYKLSKKDSSESRRFIL